MCYSTKKYLTQVLLASGFEQDEFKIYSYQGVSSVNSAKLFASFLADLNPNLTVIIYRDRDGLYDKEIESIKKDVEKTEHDVQGHAQFTSIHSENASADTTAAENVAASTSA